MILLLKRARVSFEPSGESLDGMSLIIDTELVRYKWISVNGDYPDWGKLIPTEFNTFASFDTVEAIKAVSSLKAISDSKAYAVDLTIGNGKIVMANPDDEVDNLYDQVFRELLTFMMEDPRTITRATRIIWVAYNLECTADRISNICERVVFTVTGNMEEIGASKY